MASSREKGIEGQGLECTKVISLYFMQADLQRSYLWGTLIKSLENKGMSCVDLRRKSILGIEKAPAKMTGNIFGLFSFQKISGQRTGAGMTNR